MILAASTCIFERLTAGPVPRSLDWSGLALGACIIQVVYVSSFRRRRVVLKAGIRIALLSLYPTYGIIIWYSITIVRFTSRPQRMRQRRYT